MTRIALTQEFAPWIALMFAIEGERARSEEILHSLRQIRRQYEKPFVEPELSERLRANARAGWARRKPDSEHG